MKTKLKCDYTSNDKATEAVTYIEGTQPSGEKFTEIRRVDFFPNELPEHIIDLCTNYGLRAILADRTSDATKLGINKLEWMAEIFEQLTKGEWNKKRVATGGVDRALVHLIVELKGCTAIEAENALKASTREFKDALKDKYADELDRIRNDLNKPAIDLTDL
jgi:hypothetical protein